MGGACGLCACSRAGTIETILAARRWKIEFLLLGSVFRRPIHKEGDFRHGLATRWLSQFKTPCWRCTISFKESWPGSGEMHGPAQRGAWAGGKNMWSFGFVEVFCESWCRLTALTGWIYDRHHLEQRLGWQIPAFLYGRTASVGV